MQAVGMQVHRIESVREIGPADVGRRFFRQAVDQRHTQAIGSLARLVFQAQVAAKAECAQKRIES